MTSLHLGKKRTVIILVAIAVIFVGLFSGYEAIMRSNGVKTDNLKVIFSHAGFELLHPLPSQIERGTQEDVGLGINHTRSDTVTLKTSGSAASWAYFAYYTDPPYHMLAQNETTVTGVGNGALLVINVPDDAQIGTYQITVTGTNNAGETSSDTYTFAVT